jgi:hypothetical protein
VHGDDIGKAQKVEADLVEVDGLGCPLEEYVGRSP